MTLSQSARSTPPGWSMKSRSPSVPGCSRATRSSLAVEVGQLLLNVLLEVGHTWVRGRKKSGPGPLLDTRHGTEKLVASIARSAARPACFRPQAGDLVQDRLGDDVLGVDRHLGLAVGGDQGDRVASLSKPISGSETSLRTIRSAPLRSSLPRARSTASPPCSAAKPTIVWPSARLGGERGEDVLGRLQVQLERALARCSLSVGGLGGAEVGRRGGHQQDVRRRRTPRRRRRRAGRWSRRRCAARPAGAGSATLAAISVTSAPRAAAAAARAIPIRPLERLPMKRTGSIGSRVPPAVTSTRSPSQGRSPAGSAASIRRQQPLGLGQAAAAVLAARGELALLGLDHLDPALAQRRQVRLGRRVGVHAVVHRRGDEPRRRAGEEGGGQHRVGRARRELGERVGRGGRDQIGVAAAGQLEVADRVVAGLLFAGEGAAQRVALELGDQHRGADDPLEGGGADEAGRGLGHQHPHAVARPASPAGQARAPCRRRSRR